MAASSAGLMMFALTGCSEEDLPDKGNGNVIGFTLDMGKNEDAMSENTTHTRGTRIKTDNLNTFYNGKVGVRSFYGANLYFDNVLNYESNHRWKTPVTYYWPTNTGNLDFWAWAPQTLPTGKGTRDDIKGKINNSSKTVSFNYTMQAPDATNKKDAENQQDLIFAYSSTKMTDHAGCVPLQFKHALAAIRFKIANTGVYTIQSVSMSGIAPKGNCTYAPNAVSPNPMFNWSLDGSVSRVTFVQTFTEKNVSKIESATFTELGKEETTFLIIPQTLDGSSQKLTLNYREESTNLSIEASIPAITWEAGKLYTYTITMPSDHCILEVEVEDWIPEEAEEIEF